MSVEFYNLFRVKLREHEEEILLALKGNRWSTLEEGKALTAQLKTIEDCLSIFERTIKDYEYGTNPTEE